mgnify:FL=1|jgi:hypothetical protein
MADIKDTNTFVVNAWMATKLELSGNELLLYALIYNFSQDGRSEFFGSRSYLSEFINASKRTVDGVLTSLQEKGLIKKRVQVTNGVTNNFYSVCDEKIAQGVQKLQGGGAKVAPKYKEEYEDKENYNKRNENIVQPSFLANDENQVQNEKVDLETATPTTTTSLIANNEKQELQQMVIPETRNETTIEQVIDFFDKTYSLYPRKASRGRAQTTFIHKVFARDFTESRKRALYIYKCLERQIVEWANEGNGKGRGKDFMPYMSSWLNDNFEDVPKKDRGKTK